MDLYFFQQLNVLAGKYSWLDSAAVFFAEYLGYVLIACVFLFFFKNPKKYFPMTIAGLFAAILARFGIVEIIRFFWAKPRPFIENNITLLLDHVNTASFPSGHAAFYFALSMVVFLYNKKAGIFFFFASFLMGISRVFAGVHWLSDILAGAIVGILAGWSVVNLSRRFYYKKT